MPSDYRIVVSLGAALSLVVLVWCGTLAFAQTPPPLEQRTLDQLTGLNLPDNLEDIIAAKKNLDSQTAERIAPGSELDIILSAPRTKAQEMGCDTGAKSWQWESHGIFGQVRDQGTCGACYVFATLGVVEGSYAISRHLPDLSIPTSAVVEISEEQQFTCSPGGCTGGVPRSVFDFLKTSGGSPAAGLPPYNGTQLSICPFPKKPPPFQVLAWGYTADRLNPPQEAIKSDVCTHGPVLAALSATNELSNFKGSGVFVQPGSSAGLKVNHAVVITGWDEAQHAWRIRNSWGPTFGDGGYAWINYDSNNIGRVVYWADAVLPVPSASTNETLLQKLSTIREHALTAVSPRDQRLLHD